MASDKQRLASRMLRRDVGEYVAIKRAEGLSWRRLAQALSKDTRGEVDVTAETLRAWWKAWNQ